MTTKTDNIKLPPLPQPRIMPQAPKSKIAYGYSIDDMAVYARAAVEADRQRRMPSDDELLKWAGEEQFFLFCDEDEFLQIAREVLSRYGSSQPAASAEVAHGLLQQFFDALDDALSKERASPWTGLKGAKFQDRMLAWNRVQEPRTRLLAAPVAQELYRDIPENGYEFRKHVAPVAQEPPQVTDAEIEKIVTGLGARWSGSVWKIEDADLHPLVRALLYRYTAAPVAAQPAVTDEMVTRFLGWHLPQDFAPGAGISFTPSPDPLCWPVGTDLFRDPQARAMLEYVLTGVKK